MQAVPVIDFAKWRDGTPAERRAFASHLGDVCHRVGFFHLVGHGMDSAFHQRIKDTMYAMFRLPRIEKEAISKVRSPHFRGWEPLGTELTNGRVDYREQVDTWSDCQPMPDDPERPYQRLYGPSQYFSDMVLPGYKALMQEWFALGKVVADDLLEAMAMSLDLPGDYFFRTFGDEDKRMNLTKWIHYPGNDEGKHGVNAHKDAAFLTLLLPDGPGLEIQLLTGEWIAVESVPGAFVVNLGEILQSITGQYFVATPHRVVTTRERYSCAYFHGPTLDYPLSPPIKLNPRFVEAVAASPFHRNARFMARKEETEAGVQDMGSQRGSATYGEMLWNYFSRAYPTIVQDFYGEQVSKAPTIAARL